MQDTNKEMFDEIEGVKFLREQAVPCYLCGKKQKSKCMPVSFGMHAMVAECASCRLAFQSPRPSIEASIAYMDWRWRSNDTYVGDKASQLQRARQLLLLVKQYINNQPIKLADFGAGSGAFVRVALDEGWFAKGIEQSVAARLRAKKFYDVDLCEKFDEEKYDVITIWDVIEHLREPEKTLVMIKQHLSQHGIVFIETGNFENWMRIEAKERWDLFLFDHQFYFTPISLKQVLKNAGYKDFYLIDYNHHRPSLTNVFLKPAKAFHEWRSWINAKIKWPEHDDINIMVVMARNNSI